MEGQLGLSELPVISWVSAVEGCPFPLYTRKIKRDVGMACQNITQTRNREYRSECKYTSPVPTFLWMDTALYIFISSLPCVIFWHAILEPIHFWESLRRLSTSNPMGQRGLGGVGEGD